MSDERKIAVLNHTVARLRRRIRELEAELRQRDDQDTAARVGQANTAVAKLQAIRDRLEQREPWQIDPDWWKRGKPDAGEDQTP